jgi:hypothetical protein
MDTQSPTESQPSAQEVLLATQEWLTKAVIGLNLCPFAKAVHVKQQIRYVVSTAQSEDALAEELKQELLHLHASDPEQVDTTLLIHPYVLTGFLDYNDFLAVADALLDELGLMGELQIASFHPRYQFAGTNADDIENYTNRSPYPILHILREHSIERAVAAFPDAADIYQRNIDTMRRLRLEGWQALFASSPKRDCEGSK